MQAILVVNSDMPLCFRSSRSDNSVETLPYIPGTSLLGGMAAAYARIKQGSIGFKDEFVKFFTSGKIGFGNLYPANFKSEDLADHELPVQPIPASVRSCKNFPGFRFNADNDDEERHGVFDNLISWALFALSNQEAIDVFTSGNHCSACAKRTTPFNGYYRRNTKQHAIGKANIKSRMITRTGISRKRGAVMEKILYNRKILSENQQFWGILDFQDDTLRENFESCLENAFNNEAVYLGNNKSRGMGKVGKVEFFQLTQPVDTPESLIKRVSGFSNKLKEAAEVNKLSAPHTYYIPITLQSDMILRDHLMRYRSMIEPDFFEKEWNLSGMAQIYQCSSMRRVMAWNALAGLPKADDMAITMGSIFLFGFTGNSDDAFWQTLFDIQSQGIGERRQEGFGKIMIAEPFHMEVNPL